MTCSPCLLSHAAGLLVPVKKWQPTMEWQSVSPDCGLGGSDGKWQAQPAAWWSLPYRCGHTAQESHGASTCHPLEAGSRHDMDICYRCAVHSLLQPNPTTSASHFLSFHGKIKMGEDDENWASRTDQYALIHRWHECRLVQTLWKAVWRILRKLGKEPLLHTVVSHLGIC